MIETSGHHGRGRSVGRSPYPGPVTITPALSESLAGPLAAIEHTPLGRIPAGQAAKIVRRIVDHDPLVPRLPVSAFNSAL